MKIAGLVILTIGIILSLFTGFTYMSKEKVADIGEIEITRNKNHDITLSPFVGIVVIFVGGGVLAYGMRYK
jgi:hypothetical protein